ncbi:shikimate kinase [Sulfolobales archaeon HS-7]|nr:shikimate kinase [Sulfolobales archaeon HS-7]
MSASSFGGISVVNAIPSWLGSTMAINMPVYVKAEWGKCETSSVLIGVIVDFFRRKFGGDACVIVNSSIPSSSGLKSSSAVSVAAISALNSLYNSNFYPPTVSAQLSIKAGVSITGAFDDAVASYYGGVSFTDNKRLREISHRSPPDNIRIVLLIRQGKKKIIPKDLRKFSSVFAQIFGIALSGKIIEATLLNGLLMSEILNYDQKPIQTALKVGSLSSGISGNGPSYFAIVNKGYEMKVVDALSPYGPVKVFQPVPIKRVEKQNDS